VLNASVLCRLRLFGGQAVWEEGGCGGQFFEFQPLGLRQNELSLYAKND
jgi:hypothetical protein